MKVERVRECVESSGVVSRTKCVIEANAKAFDSLARQYSNPIRAIVQEISANAIDAHTEAGNPNPFITKLPNNIDNHFRIRDFGCSMPHEQVTTQYTSYMNSTKRKSNELIGAIGLGSKTPLAYADAFNITTYLEGVKRMYTLGYDEDGIPDLAFFGEFETEERNGTEISFAVKPEDFGRFANEAKYVYSFYHVKPIVKGSSEYQHINVEKLVEGTGWYFPKEDTNTSYVVMGNVAYPINAYHLDFGRDFIRAGVVIHANIGDVSITPSREGLEYTPNTVKFLTDALKRVAEELSTVLAGFISESRSWWQASVHHKELVNRMGFAREIKTEYNGREIETGVKISSNRVYSEARRGKGGVSKKLVDKSWVPTSSKSIVVVNDLTKGFELRFRHAVRNAGKTVFVVDANFDVYSMDGKLEIQNKYDALAEQLGVVPEDGILFFASELENPVVKNLNPADKVKRNRRPANIIDGWVLDGEVWEEQEIDLNDFDGEVFAYAVSKEFPKHFQDTLEALNNTGYDVAIPTVYSVRPKHMAKIEKMTNAVLADVHIKSLIRGINGLHKELKAFLKSSNERNANKFSHVISNMIKYELPKFVNENNPLLKLMASSTEAETSKLVGISSNYINSLKDIFGIRITTEANSETYVNELRRNYPLIHDALYHSSYNIGETLSKQIVMFANMVDAEKALTK